MANLEALDAALVKAGVTKKPDRVQALRKAALDQAKSLKVSTELEHELIESPHLAEHKRLNEMEKPSINITPNISQLNQETKASTNALPSQNDKPKDGELF